MSTALATTNSNILARYGSESEINQFMQRAAAIFQIPPEDVERPDVQASLTKATQNCLRYGYLPGIHVHMIPFNRKMKVAHPNKPNETVEQWVTTYAPDMGEKAWKDSADRIAYTQGFIYDVEICPMTADEVKAATALIPDQKYHPNDAGCKARVLRSDHAKLYQMMGRKYDPEWCVGYWRQIAKEYNGKVIADTIPNGRAPVDVARRRATKAALMAVFHLVPLDEYEESMRFKKLAAYVEEETAPSTSAMPVGILHTHNGYTVDDDGEIWAREWKDARPRLMAEEAEKMGQEPTPTITSLDDVEELPFDGAPTATEEFNAIPSAPPVTNGNGHKSNGMAKQAAQAQSQPAELPDNLRKKLHAVGTQAYGEEWNTKRPELVKAITKGRSESSNDLTIDEANRMISGMEKRISATVPA